MHSKGLNTSVFIVELSNTNNIQNKSNILVLTQSIAKKYDGAIPYNFVVDNKTKELAGPDLSYKKLCLLMASINCIEQKK